MNGNKIRWRAPSTLRLLEMEQDFELSYGRSTRDEGGNAINVGWKGTAQSHQELNQASQVFKHRVFDMLDLYTIVFPFLRTILPQLACLYSWHSNVEPLYAFGSSRGKSRPRRQVFSDSPFSVFVLTREQSEVPVADRTFPCFWCVSSVKFRLQSPGMFCQLISV